VRNSVHGQMFPHKVLVVSCGRLGESSFVAVMQVCNLLEKPTGL